MTELTFKRINKVLIANRGEIACRIMKSAQKLGIRTVAVFSEADAQAMHVHMADEAVCIGPAPSRDSYLVAEKIINAALSKNVDAIHPGYGFLSENSQFASLCEQHNIIFVGPPQNAIEAMGSKSAAKEIMQKAGVPLVPGYHGKEQSPDFLKSEADKMGYPVLLKAAAGGGGKGMREVWEEKDFYDALDAAKREAKASFNDDLMLIEKFLTQPRHIEIQVFCDNFGDAIYLFERDCSIQRRHQKVIEEAPAPLFPETIRQQMGEAAIKAARAIGYSGAGTVEFLYDVDSKFYFMEMNTRLQVEHPVTEMITGEDLVEWQFTVASNQPLPKSQGELNFSGHSIEARIYAEDPENEFLPSTGLITRLTAPVEDTQVRVDTGVKQGDSVSIYYDPMIAKLIVLGKNRDQAIQLLDKSLEQYVVSGVETNINYIRRILTSDPFKNADLSTLFINRHADKIRESNESKFAHYFPRGLLAHLLSSKTQVISHAHDPWSCVDGFRLNHKNTEVIQLESEETEIIDVNIEQINSKTWFFCCPSLNIKDKVSIEGSLIDGEISGTIETDKFTHPVDIIEQKITLFTEHGKLTYSFIKPETQSEDQNEESGNVSAPMNGTVVQISVAKGDKIKKGQQIAIVEAMKMEHAIKAPFDARVLDTFYAAGDLVDGGAALIDLQEIED